IFFKISKPKLSTHWLSDNSPSKRSSLEAALLLTSDHRLQNQTSPTRLNQKQNLT
ncbi:hypothetical protein CDAR_80741, partial [Caerostris darwini]